MSNAPSDVDALLQIARQGGEVGGWIVAVFMFIVWMRSEQSHRREQAQQVRLLSAFREFAQSALRSANGPHYGLPREQDQQLLDALTKLREESIPASKHIDLLAQAIAQHADRDR